MRIDKRVIFIGDVDETFILGALGHLNTKLVQALVTNNIKQIDLCTNMSFTGSSGVSSYVGSQHNQSRPLYTRKKLIDTLKSEYGITVSSVMMPIDPYYSEQPGAFYWEHMYPLMTRAAETNTYSLSNKEKDDIDNAAKKHFSTNKQRAKEKSSNDKAVAACRKVQEDPDYQESLRAYQLAENKMRKEADGEIETRPGPYRGEGMDSSKCDRLAQYIKWVMENEAQSGPLELHILFADDFEPILRSLSKQVEDLNVKYEGKAHINFYPVHVIEKNTCTQEDIPDYEELIRKPFDKIGVTRKLRHDFTGKVSDYVQLATKNNLVSTDAQAFLKIVKDYEGSGQQRCQALIDLACQCGDGLSAQSNQDESQENFLYRTLAKVNIHSLQSTGHAIDELSEAIEKFPKTPLAKAPESIHKKLVESLASSVKSGSPIITYIDLCSGNLTHNARSTIAYLKQFAKKEANRHAFFESAKKTRNAFKILDSIESINSTEKIQTAIEALTADRQQLAKPKT